MSSTGAELQQKEATSHVFQRVQKEEPFSPISMAVRKQAVSDTEATYVLENEGHTMGNLIRGEMLHHTALECAGYKLKNPMSEEVEIYVKSKDGTTTDKVLIESLGLLREKLAFMETAFAQAFKEFSCTGGGASCRRGSGSPRTSSLSDESGKMGSKTVSGL